MPSVVVTSAGIAALLNAEQNGTLPVKITKFGLGTGNYTPTADKTALQSKFKEITALDGGAVGDNVIHVTMTDASSDAYTANEVGVYLEDGTLFALSSQPVGAILQKAAGSQALLSLDLVLQGGTGGVTVSGGTNFFNPPATTTTAGVVKLASLDEITAGTNTTKACTPMGVWRFVKNYVASAIDSLKTLLRAEIAAACLAAVPIGTMLPYAGGEVPEGFLLCNGASLSRTEYPELFAAIGDRWGSDSASTFKLPDTHHRFFEGTTVLSEVGKYVEAGLPNITGRITYSAANDPRADSYDGNSALYYAYPDQAVKTQYDYSTENKIPADPAIDASRSSSLYQNGLTEVRVNALFG